MSAEINVEGMTCEHCKSRIQKALTGCGINCSVDLDAKKVLIESGDVFVAQREITDAGYQVVGYKVLD